MADSRYAGEAGLQAVFGQIKAAMAEKQDKINDMGLSHNDYSNAEKQKNAQNASDIVALNNDIDDIIEKRDGDATLYQFAPVVTVEDAVPGNVALRAKVEVQQDLHGYSKPWVGGAGKNKLPLVLADLKTINTVGTWSDNVYTGNGVTFTVNTDNDGNVVGILANGTATGGNANFYLIAQGTSKLSAAGFINNTDYLINGCPANGSDYTYRLQVESNSAWRIDKGTGSSFTYTSGGQDAVRIQIIENYAITSDGLLFKPMIRLATEADATFVPYTNICPIVQYNSCKITRIGKNLLRSDYNYTSALAGVNITKNADGSLYCNGIITNTGYTRLLNSNVELKPNNTYIVSGMVANMGLRLYALDKNGNELGRATCYATPVQFTVPSGTASVYCNIITGSKNQVVNNTVYPQVEKAEQATAWKPYKSNYYSIELNGNTYYGQLRIDTQGNVCFDIDKSVVEFDGSEDEGWSMPGGTSAAAFLMQIYLDVQHIKNSVTGNESELVTNQIEYTLINATWGDLDAIVSYPSSNDTEKIYVGIKSITTVSGWKTYLASNPLQVCYKILTPFTIVLKDTPINFVKGQNTIYADTGDVEVTVNNILDAIGSVQEQADNLINAIGWNNAKNLFDEVYTDISSNIVKRTIYVGNGIFTLSTDMPLNGAQANLFLQSGTGTASATTSANGVSKDNPKTFASEDGYVTIKYRNTGGVDPRNYHTQLEVGSVPTDYEPYNPVIGQAVEELLDKVPNAPTTDGAYVLTVTVADGIPTYSWESTT